MPCCHEGLALHALHMGKDESGTFRTTLPIGGNISVDVAQKMLPRLQEFVMIKPPVCTNAGHTEALLPEHIKKQYSLQREEP